MDRSPAVDSLSLLEQVVLLAIADADAHGETPVASLTIKEHCEALLDHVEADVVGDLTERELMRALNTLGTEPYVRETQSTTSPTGKGRPTYALDMDPTAVLTALDAEDRLTPAVETVRNR